MSDYQISIDAGNGVTNAARQMKRGVKTIAFPSVRAAVTGDSLGKDAVMQLQYDYAQWGNTNYVWGDTVLKVSRGHIDRLQGRHRYGDEQHQFLAAVATAMLGVKKGNVDLSLFVPPGLYADIRDAVLNAFCVDDGKVKLHLNTESRARKWRYSRIRVFPEGLAAAACFVLADDGQPLQTDVLDGQVLILDMGMYTLDSLLMVDGNFNPETLSIATNEQLGLRAMVLDPILRIARNSDSDMQVIMADDVDKALRSGLETGDYSLRSGQSEINSHDMQTLIERHAEKLAKLIADNIIERNYNGLRGIKGCILVGGGAVLTASYLQQMYGTKIMQPDDYEQTKALSSVEMNAVGGLRLAQMQMRAGR